MARLSRLLADFLWPSPDKKYLRRQKEENYIFRREIEKIFTPDHLHDANFHGSKENSEKIKKHENNQNILISSRIKKNIHTIFNITIISILLTAACLVLPSEKSSFHSSMAGFFFICACIYLSLQWVAALRATILGMKPVPFLKSLPDEIFYLQTQIAYSPTRKKINNTNEINDEIKLNELNELKNTILKSIPLREANEIRRDRLEVANRAINNYLWGLLFFAIIIIISTMVPSPIFSCISTCGIIDKQITTTENTNSQLADGMPMTLLIALAATFAILGAALLLLGKTWFQKIVGIIMLSGGLTLGFSGKAKFDTTLFKLDNLVGEIKFNLSNVNKIASSQRPYYTFIRKVATIGPFPDGGHLLDEHKTIQCVQNALALYNKIQVGGWEIIGRVDKRPLKPQPMGIYGSNQALAMARASWVVQKTLTPQPIFNVEHAVISVGGAQGIGTSVGTSDMQSDRAVDIFAMVNSHNDKDELATLPKPVACP